VGPSLYLIGYSKMKGKMENLQNYNGKTEYFKLKGLKWNNNESTGNNNNKSKSM
jgi:hypothetical protein